MSAKPDKALLRTLTDADVGALTGYSAAEVRRALRGLADLATADTAPETRAAMLAALTARRGEADLGPEVVDRILAAAPRLERITDLVDVAGIGPLRFLSVVDSLASANVPYLLDQEDRWEAALRLRSGLDRGRARELFDLVAAGRAEDFLGPDFPLLAEITDVVCNPDRVDDPGFDASAFAARLVFMGALLPTPELIAFLLDDDEEEGPADAPAPVGDPPPREVLDELWPRPEGENREDCPRVELVFDPVRVEPPQLGDVRGLREVLAELVNVQITAARLALTTFALADAANQLNPFGVQFPPTLRLRLTMALAGLSIAQGDTPDPDPGPSSLVDDLTGLADRMLQSIVRILQTRIVFTDPTRPARIVRPTTTLLVTGPPGTDLSFAFVSRMLSAYRYGVGAGTQFFGSADEDLPWFAKIDVRPFRTAPVQLGAGKTGMTGTQEGATGGAFLSIPGNGRLSLPVALNGNYGLARVTAQLDNATCRYSSNLFRVLGAFQEDVAAEAALRYDNTEEGIRKIEIAADAIDDLVDVINQALGILVGIGDAVAALISIVKVLLRQTLQLTLEIARVQNRRQRMANLEIADAYPRRLNR